MHIDIPELPDRDAADRLAALLSSLRAYLSAEDYTSINRMIMAGKETVALECLGEVCVSLGLTFSAARLEEISRLIDEFGADASFWVDCHPRTDERA